LRTSIVILIVLALAAPGASAAAAGSNVGGVLSKAIEAERTADYDSCCNACLTIQTRGYATGPLG